ncbi:MAG: RNA polymerase subunit sigma-70 [Clostridia bacterium]|nr:RNA polymerase subunit sigma-70 [Clostridia bacterium]
MDKDILSQYIDACAIIKETEEEIHRIKRQRKTIVQSVVKGSMHGFPYTSQNFHIEGIPYSVVQDPRNLGVEERLLEQQKANAQALKLKVEAWMLTIPMRMQRIIRYAIFEKLSWGEVANRMGRKATADGVRMEFQRFMEEK